MKKVLVAVLLGVLTGGAAQAADLGRMPAKAPPPVVAPIYNWNGFYIGGHVGWGWGRTDWSDPTGVVVGSDRIDVDGFLAGGQIGYLWQFNPNWVFGIEGQGSWTNMDGGLSVAIPGGSASLTNEINWIASVTGKLGYAANNWLFYVKGGGAWADYDHTASLTVGATTLSATSGDTRSGWTAGGGIEWGFAPNWSALIEYQFYDFGSENTPFPGVPAATFAVDSDIHTVKLGVNYRFGPLR